MNDRCWLLELAEDESDESGSCASLHLIKTFLTDFGEDDSYQKVVRYSPNGEMFATAGTEGVIRVWNESKKLYEIEAKDVCDLTFSDADTMFLAFVTPNHLIIYDMDTIDQKAVATPSEGFQFRCIAHVTGLGFAAAENGKNRKSATITIWETLSLKSIKIIRLPVSKPITTIASEPSSSFLAFGCADGTVGVICLQRFKVLFISQAHSFAVTSVQVTRSNMDSKDFLLISGSADGTIKTSTKPPSTSHAGFLFLVFLSILILILAYIIRQQPDIVNNVVERGRIIWKHYAHL